MPRPYQPIKRIKSNSDVWYVQLRDTNGKRHSLSLETTDRETAMRRYGQAIKMLQARIKAQEEASKPSKWLADEPLTEWDIPSNADGSNDYANAKPVEKTWGEIANDDQIRRLSWEDLIREAEDRRKQKEGKSYSPAWHEACRIAIADCPFGPEHATPENIRLWIKAMRERGLAPKTIQLRCSSLSGLITSSIKTGFRQDLLNGFNSVDYVTKKVVSHVTATDEDLSLIKGVAQTLPKEQELALLIELFTGCRALEVKQRVRTDLEVDGEGIGWLTVTEGKTEASNRTIPLPEGLTSELVKHWPKAWPHGGTLNKKLKAGVRKEITNHSLRHAQKRLHRAAGLDSVLSEALLGHELGSANRQVLESVYGGDYPREQLLEGARKIWQLIDQLPTTK